MCKIYNILIPSIILYLISSSPLHAENVKNFKLNTKLLESGDVELSSSIIKSNNACIYLSYVQILRNYESEIESDMDGTPILSRWETVWENRSINLGNTSLPKVDIEKATLACKRESRDSAPKSFSDRLVNAVLKLAGKADPSSTFNNQGFMLKQGEKHLGFQHLNQSSDYEDAELKIAAIYIKPPTGSIFQATPFGPKLNKGEHKLSTQVISLKPTRMQASYKADHNFSYPGFVEGKKIPLAYMASGENLGCLGREASKRQKRPPLLNKLKALASKQGVFKSTPQYDCYYANNPSQKAVEIPSLMLRERTANDILIMCPGSRIPETLSYKHFKRNNIALPTAKSAPYLQVMAEGNPAWCNDIDKAERQWRNLHSVSNEGWLISQNTFTQNLECLASHGVCINTLYSNAKFNEMLNQPANLINLSTLVLTNQDTRQCQYKDGTSADCPEQFSSPHNTVNNLLQTLQFEAMRRSIN